MTTTAVLQGRNLHLSVEGIGDPFVIPPLPGNAGEQITATYLAKSHPLTADDVTDVEMTEALMMAVDGGVKNTESGLWSPREPDQRTVWNRNSNELQLAEAQDVIMPAFLWQTVLGARGVASYLEAGGGDAGTLRGLLELVTRLGIGGVQVVSKEPVANLLPANVGGAEVPSV